MSYTQIPDWIPALQLPAGVEQVYTRVRMYTRADREDGHLVVISDQEIAELLGIGLKQARRRLAQAQQHGVLVEQARWTQYRGTRHERQIRRWHVATLLPEWWDGRPGGCWDQLRALTVNGGPGLHAWQAAVEDEGNADPTGAEGVHNPRTDVSEGSAEPADPGTSPSDPQTDVSEGCPNPRTDVSPQDAADQEGKTPNKGLEEVQDQQARARDAHARAGDPPVGGDPHPNEAGPDSDEAIAWHEPARQLLAQLPLPAGTEPFVPHARAVRSVAEALATGMPSVFARRYLLDGVATADSPGGKLSHNADRLPAQARDLVARAERSQQRASQERRQGEPASPQHQQRTSQWIRQNVLHKRPSGTTEPVPTVRIDRQQAQDDERQRQLAALEQLATEPAAA